MMSNFMVGLIAGLGVSAWVYSYIMKTTGGRTKDAIIVAASAAVGTMAVVMVLLGFLF